MKEEGGAVKSGTAEGEGGVVERTRAEGAAENVLAARPDQAEGTEWRAERAGGSAASAATEEAAEVSRAGSAGAAASAEGSCASALEAAAAAPLARYIVEHEVEYLLLLMTTLKPSEVSRPSTATANPLLNTPLHYFCVTTALLLCYRCTSPVQCSTTLLY